MGHPRVPPDDDPTLEEEAPEFDGSSTDQLGEAYRLSVVSASERSAGKIDHDDRGTSRWKWKTEAQNAPADPMERTFDHLKSLNHPKLTVEGEEPHDSGDKPAGPKGGYDPYSTGIPKRKPTRKP
jgi:hypothetical protein